MTSTDTKDLLDDLEFISDNPDIEPSVNSGKTNVKSNSKQSEKKEETTVSAKNHRRPKNGLAHAFLPITILLSLTTLASIALCFYLLHQMNTKEVPATADSVMESRMYAQEEVDVMVLDAKEEAQIYGLEE